ncbi:serine hydrolase [uncultured Erythrobacter sp.]|uniref:serine hydrolase domain-containing protein n=1 Tax=uncultured Erythrobacter sp. TaxID=263913 RepID=UPI0026369DF6|nr:serine hydrolase [uncultured Erythrobacter sp.]
MFEALNKVGVAIALAVSVIATPAAAQPIPDLTIEQMEAQIRAGQLGKIRAVAAEQGGETVYRERFGKGELGDRVDIKSAGKSITALAIGAAIADGHLEGTDLKVWPYLGTDRGEPHNTITVGDLLSMSSALDCNDWDRGSPGQEEKMYRKRIWRDFALALPAREYERDADGDGPFSYCTAGVFLLGQVVEKAVGERFDLYVQRRLFDPLGIDGAEWRTSRSGEIQSGGQLTISDTALLKIARMVMDGGMCEGERILPEDWLRTTLTSRHQLGVHTHYGYLWWAIPIRSSRGYEAAFMMKGNGGNVVAIVPTLDAVLVVQSEHYNRKKAEWNTFVVLTTLLRSMPVPDQSPIEG